MRVIWFDRERVLLEVREAAARLAAEHPEVERVVLFGSVARGDCVPGSDADVLVVIAGDEIAAPGAWIDRLRRYSVSGVSCGVDVFAYTSAELDDRSRRGDRFIADMLREGVEVYRRSG